MSQQSFEVLNLILCTPFQHHLWFSRFLIAIEFWVTPFHFIIFLCLHSNSLWSLISSFQILNSQFLCLSLLVSFELQSINSLESTKPTLNYSNSSQFLFSQTLILPYFSPILCYAFLLFSLFISAILSIPRCLSHAKLK